MATLSLDMGPQALGVLSLLGFLSLPTQWTNGVEHYAPNAKTLDVDDPLSGSQKRPIQLLVETPLFGQPMPLHFGGHSPQTIQDRTRRQTTAQIGPQSAQIGTNASAARDVMSQSTNVAVTKGPPKDFMKKELQGKVVVKIGHIGAQGAMPNGDRVLEISRMALLDEGILGDELDFDLTSSYSIQSVAACGDSYEGVAVAASMYHKERVRAFLGPYCASEFEAVAKMCSFWNIPAISYMPTTTAVSDRNIYKTLARLSSKNTNSIAKALIRLVEHYNWKKLAIVTNTGPIAYERVSAFEDEFRKTNTVTVVKKVVLDENWDANEMMRSGLLGEVAANARVVVCIFSYTRELTREFMSAVSRLNMNTAEYAYILPWLQSGPKDASPWTGTSGEVLQQVKDTYANAIIVDDVNGFDNVVMDTFMTRIEKYGMVRDDIDLTNTFAYLHLYDSLKLYALAARRVLNKTMDMDGNGTEAVLDGHQIWNAMRKLSFEGIGSVGGGVSTGFVQMDDLADRAPQFAAFFIAPNRDKVLKMVQMAAYRVPNCDGLINKSGCYDLKLTDVITGFWPSDNGSLPPDEPICGFRGQRCSYTIEIAIGATIIALILLVFLAWTLRRYCQTRALNKMSWRLFSDDFRLIDEETAKSLMSIASGNTKMSNMSTGGSRKHAILGVNTHATYSRFIQKQPLKFQREDLVLLTAVKDAVHDNINPFLGMAFNDKEEMFILWKFCSRGTVQDIVYNKNMALDEKFHAAFVRDITLGLEYLHLSKIGFHGSLTPSACVIDRNWSVRLTDFGLANMLDRWLKENQIVPFEEGKKKEAEDGTRKRSGGKDNYSIYCPPEMLKNREQNRRRRMDQSWLQQSIARKQAGDIYAFGIVMYEILFRALPFSKETDLSGVGSAGDDGSRHIRPTIQDKETQIHPDMAALLIDCWSENAEIRPSIRRVRLNTESVLKCRGSLVEQMMRVMEQYANNLEKLVKERTEMLEEANTRADRLLNQLLPPYVALELKAGRRVPPEMFSSATILFSNIVGFTRICQESTPLEVVNLLNGIYAGFDEKIHEYEAYKVETIGDAYMIVAGIPPPKEQSPEAQTKHVEQVSNIALSMRKFLEGFEIPHRRREKVKCRWGFHTGPVATGVVGLTAPRYCLFGDTVNTASRMESTGLPEKIQISEQSFLMLSTHYPEFVCEHRGQVEIKGKGLCTTYWLAKKNLGHMSAEQRQLKSFQQFY